MNTQLVCMPGSATPIELPSVQASSSQFPEEWFFNAVTMGSSDSGETVTPRKALMHGPLWQGINILSGDLGQLPMHKMVRKGRDTEKDRGHPASRVFLDAPNDYQTPSVWKETVLSWAILWGNSLCEIVRERNSIRLLPIAPDTVSYEVLDDGTLVYIVTVNGVRHPLLQKDVFHIRGLVSDGIWGYSLVEIAKNVIGHGLALQKHGNMVFKNGARPSGVLEHPDKLGPEGRNNLRTEWNQLHQGLDNTARIAVLQEGIKFAPLAVSNEDAQWLEARRFDREMVASLLNLPAFKLNALENSAVRANLEEQNRDYFNTSLSRWLNRFAEEAQRKLLTDNERRTGDHFFRWFPESFLKGDVKSRYEAYSMGISSRILSPNEAREKEDMNPYDGGDEFLNPNIETAGAGNAEQVAALRAMVSDRVEHLLNAESNRIQQHATQKEAAKFNAWLEGYGEWFVRLANDILGPVSALLQTHGVESQSITELAGTHANQSRAALLEVSGWVKPSELPGAVEKVSETIKQHSDDLVAKLMGETGHGLRN